MFESMKKKAALKSISKIFDDGEIIRNFHLTIMKPEEEAETIKKYEKRYLEINKEQTEARRAYTESKSTVHIYRELLKEAIAKNDTKEIGRCSHYIEIFSNNAENQLKDFGRACSKMGMSGFRKLMRAYTRINYRKNFWNY